MAQVIYSPRAVASIERAYTGLAELADDDAAGRALTAIESALSMLSAHPLIGRTAPDGLRELVISFGRSGYVALYQYFPEHDEVWVLAIKHQRELGYP